MVKTSTITLAHSVFVSGEQYSLVWFTFDVHFGNFFWLNDLFLRMYSLVMCRAPFVLGMKLSLACRTRPHKVIFQSQVQYAFCFRGHRQFDIGQLDEL